MEYVLQTYDLTKNFRKKPAVNKVNMSVRKGEIYGFIGKNGAGKTTLIRMAAGLAKPTEGSIKLFGGTDLGIQRRKIGTMIENPAMYPGLTAKQNLHYYCRLLDLDPNSTIDSALTLVGLTDTGKKKAKNFSLGMKQRLAIAIALLADPEFLMLDEPINGLDPSGIKDVRELVLKLNREKNITILISSHILGELSKIATCYGVINDGILIDEFTREQLEERCKGTMEIRVNDIDKTEDILKDKFGIIDYKAVDANTIHIFNNHDLSGEINMELAKNGITVFSCSVVGQDIEGYFMQLMSVN